MARTKRRKMLMIILPLAFLLLVVLLVLFNKSTVRELVPIDYITDPWPTQQACPIHNEKE